MYHDLAVRGSSSTPTSSSPPRSTSTWRPDEERYASTAGSAMVIFSPDGMELGAPAIAPNALEILKEVVVPAARAGGKTEDSPCPSLDTPMSEEQIAWIACATELDPRTTGTSSRSQVTWWQL